MTYDPNIPTNLPSPSAAVDQIRINFTEYANIFDNNHVAINLSNQGKHSNVILQVRGNDPDVISDFSTLYGKRITTNSSSKIQAFTRVSKFLPDPLSNPAVQLTFDSVNTAGPVYQSFISGGYIVYFGTSLIGTITLSPAPTEIICVIANVIDTPKNVSVLVLNNFQFQINSTIAGSNHTWWAIAKQ
jgi:predicted ATPase